MKMFNFQFSYLTLHLLYYGPSKINFRTVIVLLNLQHYCRHKGITISQNTWCLTCLAASVLMVETPDTRHCRHQTPGTTQNTTCCIPVIQTQLFSVVFVWLAGQGSPDFPLFIPSQQKDWIIALFNSWHSAPPHLQLHNPAVSQLCEYFGLIRIAINPSILSLQALHPLKTYQKQPHWINSLKIRFELFGNIFGDPYWYWSVSLSRYLSLTVSSCFVDIVHRWRHSFSFTSTTSTISGGSEGQSLS